MNDLKQQALITKQRLHDALVDKFQLFLLELGQGFCLEERQKKLIINDKPCFIDLVFYHRILKCHVLIQLNQDAFRQESINQLNTYVSYYKKYQMLGNDQPPIGILLCTQKHQEMLKLALGDNNNVFMSRYELQLPVREIETFLKQAIAELDCTDS